ncbi:MAG: glycosyltransferase [Actinomycetota bacterium]|jgi:trehalose synthase
MRDVPVRPLRIEALAPVIGAGRVAETSMALESARQALGGHTVWTVNSTATGGGVAEMLVRILGYTSGAGIDSPWLVLEGDEPFFRITKRIHHKLHGMPGDGPLLPGDRRHYERVMAPNAEALGSRVRPGDIVVLNDPQTVGLAGSLRDCGAAVVWRNHIGADTVNEHTDQGWAFLRPYLGAVDLCVFTRQEYAPHPLPSPFVVMPPTIDPLSAKNGDLDPVAGEGILEACGLGPVPPGAPLVVQVSRWDPLKDPVGVMDGFLRLEPDRFDAHLALVGPDTAEVADDPEGQQVFEGCLRRWRALPEAQRRRIHLVSLSMADVEENARMVNAIQRRATVVVQKSLAEGFGLTVTEAMWKRKPVLASAVGGIQDQIVHGRQGWLLSDPSDPAEFAAALDRLLRDRVLAASLAADARRRVQEQFLDDRQLCEWAQIFERLAGSRRAA